MSPPQPAVDLNFAANQFSGASLANLSVTRAQTVSSYADNFDGTVTAFAANTLRVGVGFGILAEETRTNLLLHSDDISDPAWTMFTNNSGTITRTGNAGIAPDGTNAATLLALNRSSGSDFAAVLQAFTATAATYSSSVYFKAATNSDIGQTVSIAYDLVGSSSLTATVPMIVTGGWQRISISTVLTAASYQMFFGYNDHDGGSTGAVNILVWRGQAELGAGPTSGIPTTTAPVTRNADIITASGPILSAYQSAAVTQYVKTTNTPVTVAGSRAVGFNGGASPAFQGSATVASMFIGSGSPDQATIGNSVSFSNAGSPSTMAPVITVSSYSASGDSIVANGGTETTSTNVMPSPSSVFIGSDGSGNFLNGYISRLALWTSQLSSAQRIAFSQTYNFTAPTIGGQTAQYLVPTAPLNGKLIMYVHGAGDTLFWLNSGQTGIREALLAQGYILAASTTGGDDWGNQTGLNSYIALYADTLTRFPSASKVMIYGGSMGGICSLLLIGNNSIPVKAWYATFPATNLAEEYSLSFTAAINGAYNIPAGGTYAAQTAGHDPNLLSGSLYTIPMRFIASPGDTVVPKAQNTDLEAAKVSATTPEHFVLVSTGNHGDASNFLPSDVVNFYGRY